MYFKFIHLFLFFACFFPICICFFIMFFVLIPIHLNHFFGEIIKYVFLFYFMLIVFFERAGAGVDTDRFACIFS